MSLGRLLTTGKSLVDLKNSTSQYRMRSKSLLPKFGSAKNPFVTLDNSKPEAPAAASETVPAGPANESGAAKSAEVIETQPKAVKQLPVAAPARKPVMPKQPERIGRSFGKLNPLSWWRSRKRDPKPAIPRFNHQPVQGELSLDSVKVMRNDLTDADVEIVQAKATVAQQKPAPASPARQAADLMKT